MTELEKENSKDESNVGATPATAQIILAWRSLLSSKEAQVFMESALGKITELFGQTKEQQKAQYVFSFVMLVAAFACIGILSHYKLISDGTTGVLAGVIIGYFFKKDAN